ncbi:glucokinase [Herbaspirillum sp. RTI4]|uniref:glucokinase n=1 Tax=Herbaspirillum sp. RTI4 TaxID=3048640 RepID=UPI002AB4A572|nr:glucokinase [Herbaspirillum sp. RTI4]MDY7579071.1 glucokinase [Herbaspirillum sp. RTI4]MEA9982345.1 glucokinase [Herbaspirillum sp. RTI4]
MSMTSSSPSDTRPQRIHGDRWPCLLGDIGGTFARFCIETAVFRRTEIAVFRCDDYPDLGAVIAAYLAQTGQTGNVRHGGIAIATAVQGDWLSMPNRPWAFSIEDLRRELDFDVLHFFNDFTALAMALPGLAPDEFRQIGTGQAPEEAAVIGVLGAGTGLGVGGLVPCGDGWRPLHSEGGHVSFSPCNAEEAAVLEYCWGRFEHVSQERLLSGPGIQTIYQALRAKPGAALSDDDVPTTADLVRRGTATDITRDPLSAEAVDLFCGMLGNAAANLALTIGARGGIYIGGGVLTHMQDYFVQSSFRQRFETHGRAGDFLARIPTYFITAPYPAMSGLSRLMAQDAA